MLYFQNLLRTTAPETAPQRALRNCFREVREEPGCIGVFWLGEKKVINHQKISGKHRKQASQVNDCLFIGKMQESGLIEIIP